MLGVSIRAYARANGVYHRAIQHAIEVGIIVPLPDGSIDVEQANATWGRRHAAMLAPVEMDPQLAARLDAELAETDRLLDIAGFLALLREDYA